MNHLQRQASSTVEYFRNAMPAAEEGLEVLSGDILLFHSKENRVARHKTRSASVNAGPLESGAFGPGC
ncbi:MAG: hypothetical protein KJO98_15195 [Rhodothermia bacterium]|nr:hypothetical protein [Rhodothermia bacterium]